MNELICILRDIRRLCQKCLRRRFEGRKLRRSSQKWELYTLSAEAILLRVTTAANVREHDAEFFSAAIYN
jgi:hypothetical protein